MLAVNPLAVFDGNLANGRTGNEFNLTIEMPEGSGTHSAVVGLMLTAPTGSSFDPGTPQVVDSDGRAVPPVFSTANLSGRDGLTLVEMHAGEYTVRVGSESGSGTSGEFHFEVFLPGDARTRDGQVDEAEFLHATAAVVQKLGTAGHVSQLVYRGQGIDLSGNLYLAGLDANQDGTIDSFDLQQVGKNRGIGPLRVSLLGDENPPVIEVELANDTGTDPGDRITTDATITGMIRDESQIGSLLIGINGPPTFDLLSLPAAVSASGDIVLTPEDLTKINGAPLEDGPLTLRFVATDELGNSTSQPVELSFTLIVSNNAPSVTSIPDRVAEEDRAFQFDVKSFISDSDQGDVIVLSASGENASPLPGWLTFDAQQGVFRGTPRNQDVGTFAVEVSAVDSQGARGSDVFVVTVNNVNDAPIVTPIADQIGNEDVPLSFQVLGSFSDVDPDDVLSLAATLEGGEPLPDWLHFDPSSGTFSGTPSQSDVGTLSIVVTATDLQDSNVSDTFDLVIRNTNDAPRLVTDIEDQRLEEDVEFRLDVSEFFEDPDVADTLTYQVSTLDGGALPSWLTFDPVTGVLAGTPRNGDDGVISIRVTATDSALATAADTLDLFVNNVNDPPTARPIPDQQAMEDVAFQLDVSNFFDDVDPGDSLAFFASLTGGGALPSWLRFDETGVFRGTPSNDDVQTISIDVTAIDAGLEQVVSTFGLTVLNDNDAPMVVGEIEAQSVDQDEPFVLDTGGLFADEDVGDTLTFSATADGASLPTWLSIDANTGVLSGTPRNDDVGLLRVEVTATDAAGAAAKSQFDLTVNNVNDAPIIEDQSLAIDPDSPDGTVVGVVAARDPDQDDTITFAIVGGDPGGFYSINAKSGEIRIIDSSVLATSDTFELTVEVTDSASPALSDAATVTIRVTPNNPPTAVPIPGQQAVEDAPFQFDASGFFSDVDPEDTLTFSATLANGNPLPAWLTIDSATGVLTGVPENQNVGTITVRVTATDPPGDGASSTFTLVIENVNDSPIVVSAIPDQVVDEDARLELDVAAFFRDPDVGDTLSFTATRVGGGPLPSWLSIASDTGILGGVPENEHVGTVAVEVRATDLANEFASAIFTVTVRNTNDAPIAADDAGFETEDDTPLTLSSLDLLGNDRDPDRGDTVTLSGVVATSSLGAAVTLVDGGIRYDPTTSEQLVALSFGEQLVDSFTYTVEDTEGLTDTATVSVTVHGTDLIRFRLETTDLNGTPISRVTAGDRFVLRTLVQDVQDAPVGVFAAYLDVDYDSDLISPSGPLQFGESYPFAQSGILDQPGVIDEAGGFADFTPLGGAEYELFRIEFTAGDRAGAATLAANPADDVPLRDVLLFFGTAGVPTVFIDYGSTTIQVESPAQAALSASEMSLFAALRASTDTAQYDPNNTAVSGIVPAQSVGTETPVYFYALGRSDSGGASRRDGSAAISVGNGDDVDSVRRRAIVEALVRLDSEAIASMAAVHNPSTLPPETSSHFAESILDDIAADVTAQWHLRVV